MIFKDKKEWSLVHAYIRSKSKNRFEKYMQKCIPLEYQRREKRGGDSTSEKDPGKEKEKNQGKTLLCEILKEGKLMPGWQYRMKTAQWLGEHRGMGTTPDIKKGQKVVEPRLARCATELGPE